MESLYFLIPISLLVCIIAVVLFFWSVNSGQYEDLDGEAERILFDDDDLTETKESSNEQIDEKSAGDCDGT